MSIRALLLTVLLCLLPVSELRGGLPYALSAGLPLAIAFPLCVVANALVAPLLLLFLSSLHRLLQRWAGYARLSERILERARRSVHAKVERYGYVGLFLFVAIPLPFTGAYTGTLGAWVLGMDSRKTMLAVLAGVVTAGIIVSAVALLGIRALELFLRK
jgi:uncharacterized membrane protein